MNSVREQVPRDLALVGVCTLVADLAVVAPVPAVGVPFGVLLALFLPGYALLSALAPGRGLRSDDGDSSLRHAERAAFSVGASVVTTAVVAAALNFTPVGIERLPVLLCLNAVVFLSSAVAVVRREESPDGEQRDLSAVASDYRSRLAGDGGTGTAVNALLAVSLLLVVGTTAYAVAGPSQGATYTEFYLLTENESGDLVAGGYPTEFVRGENRSLYIGINNRERRPMNYTVVVETQRVGTENGSTVVLQGKQAKRMQVRVKQNTMKRVPHRVAPTMVGDRLRLTYLLYRGQPPSNPTVENAYREVHLLVDVSANTTAIR